MGYYVRNGQAWYRDAHPPLKRIRRWFVSTGLEKAIHTSAGYAHVWDAPLAQIRRSIRLHPGRSRAFGIYAVLCPLSLFNDRFVCYSFGFNLRHRNNWYCLTYDIVDSGPQWRKQWKCFRSRNAAPRYADRWYFGAPREVVQSAAQASEHATKRVA